jgi:tRNA nucleotidyltransferase (CCA-adding enzyme)
MPLSPDPLELVEKMARQLLVEQACLSLKDLAINGRDCMDAGLHGKEIGTTLNRLLELVAEGTVENKREILIQEIKKSSS